MASNLMSLVGHTPLVQISQFDTGPCELFIKLESQNPGSSIKDRPAIAMIDAAEREGKLKPGGTIIEATAGNTGIALALIAQQKGYKTLLIVPDKMAREKVLHMRALGAEVVITRSDVEKGHPDYYQDIAARIAKEMPGAVYIDQFTNMANPWSHEYTTAPELYDQMNKDVDAVVVGVGTGGTLTGLGRFFAKVSPKTEMVLADPVGSILAPLVNTGQKIKSGSWLVEGIGEDFVPKTCDLSFVKKAYSITDEQSFHTARMVLQKEGLMGGSSSGTLIAAAIEYCKEQTEKKRVVTFLCDSGTKYLSKMYNDAWLFEEGVLDRQKGQTLADVIAREFRSGDVVNVSPKETLKTAFIRMKSADVSQLPVIEMNKVVGIVDESDLLSALLTSAEHPSVVFMKPVKDVMTTKIRTLSAKSTIQDAARMMEEGCAGIVMNEHEFLGMITRTDLINYFRKASKA